MSLRDKLRKILLLSMLGFASFGGAPMDPEKIEELQRLMNQTRVEVVVTDQRDHDVLGLSEAKNDAESQDKDRAE